MDFNGSVYVSFIGLCFITFLHAPRVQESTFRLYLFIYLYMAMSITCYFSCVSLVQTYCYELYHI